MMAKRTVRNVRVEITVADPARERSSATQRFRGAPRLALTIAL